MKAQPTTRASGWILLVGAMLGSDCGDSSVSLGTTFSVLVSVESTGDGEFPASYIVELRGPYDDVGTHPDCNSSMPLTGFGTLRNEIDVPSASVAPFELTTNFTGLGSGCYRVELVEVASNCHGPNLSDDVALTDSNETAHLNVQCDPLPPGVIQGILYDVDSTTALDGASIRGGPIVGSSGTTFAGLTGEPSAGDPEPVSSGGYRFEVDPGRYAVFTRAVLGSRWISTPGDTADVLSADTTDLTLYVTRGYGLDMRGTDVGAIQAGQGDEVDLTIDYRAWNRDLCPACEPSIAVGVEGTALTVYRFDSPGTYPGTPEDGVTITVTVPDHGGTIYAMLVTTSTAGGIQPGLDLYEDRWTGGFQETDFIPLGTLSLN